MSYKSHFIKPIDKLLLTFNALGAILTATRDFMHVNKSPCMQYYHTSLVSIAIERLKSQYKLTNQEQIFCSQINSN